MIIIYLLLIVKRSLNKLIISLNNNILIKLNNIFLFLKILRFEWLRRVFIIQKQLTYFIDEV